MFKSVFKFSALALLFISMVLVSCDDDSLIDTSDDTVSSNFTASSDDDYERGHRRGRHNDCFDINFPVSLSFPDGTIETYESKDSLRAGLKEYKRNRDESIEGRPTFVFPISVTLADSTTQEIADSAAFSELKQSCRPAPCFTLVFPVTVVFPDSTTASYDDRTSMKEGIRAFRTANPDVDGKPSLQFPVSVTLADGTTSEIADEDAFEDLREECHGDDDDDDDDRRRRRGGGRH